MSAKISYDTVDWDDVFEAFADSDDSHVVVDLRHDGMFVDFETDYDFDDTLNSVEAYLSGVVKNSYGTNVARLEVFSSDRLGHSSEVGFSYLPAENVPYSSISSFYTSAYNKLPYELFEHIDDVISFTEENSEYFRSVDEHFKKVYQRHEFDDLRIHTPTFDELKSGVEFAYDLSGVPQVRYFYHNDEYASVDLKSEGMTAFIHQSGANFEGYVENKYHQRAVEFSYAYDVGRSSFSYFLNEDREWSGGYTDNNKEIYVDFNNFLTYVDDYISRMQSSPGYYAHRVRELDEFFDSYGFPDDLEFENQESVTRKLRYSGMTAEIFGDGSVSVRNDAGCLVANVDAEACDYSIVRDINALESDDGLSYANFDYFSEPCNNFASLLQNVDLRLYDLVSKSKGKELESIPVSDEGIARVDIEHSF